MNSVFILELKGQDPEPYRSAEALAARMDRLGVRLYAGGKKIHSASDAEHALSSGYQVCDNANPALWSVRGQSYVLLPLKPLRADG